jgi:Flp pilus assembly protein protease CpaA
MITTISNILVTILDALKAVFDAIIGHGVVGAGAVYAVFFIALVVGVFFIALNGKTGAY